jgi:ribonucleoside-diphosphate reductase alpha chain
MGKASPDFSVVEVVSETTYEAEPPVKVEDRHLHPPSRGMDRDEWHPPTGNGGNGGNGGHVATGTSARAATAAVGQQTRELRLRIAEARLKGYEGDPCGACASFTLVRNGTCLKCVSCGATSGCS